MLCLISAYTTQQARTINAADELINGSRGRLETSLFIAIHKDRHGSLKLKKWGRERGIAVLPIYVDNNAPTEEDAFARSLAFELFSHDPFDVTGPVADDTHFYGRRTEAIDLARKLQTGQIRACFGIRKSGKTSIIHRVIKEFNNNYKCFSVVCDCSRDAIFSLNAPELILSIARTISDHYMPGESCDVSVVKEDRSISESSNLLQNAVEQVDEPLILVFDEDDYITPASPTAALWKTEFNPLWRNLRAIYQRSSRDGRSISILVSGVSSKWFSIEAIEGVENAALAFVPEKYLVV